MTVLAVKTWQRNVKTKPCCRADRRYTHGPDSTKFLCLAEDAQVSD